jgi:uncharacterized membrane protein
MAMSPYIPALLIGVVAGLRSMTAPAIVSWAVQAGWLHLENTPLAFLGYSAMPYIFTALAIAELIADKLPSTPSRKTAPGFAARILMGALSGAAVGASNQMLTGGLLLGVVGALLGTLGGYEGRVRLARAIQNNDLPVAIFEDALAVCGAIWIVSR